MKLRRLLAAASLLLTVSCRLSATARHGCLFDKMLCPRELICSDDGLFGSCQDPWQDQVRYQVTVPVLHSLQKVLKDLLVQGLTWKDDVTQVIIGQELSQIPTSGLERLEKSIQHQADDLDDPEVMQQYLDYMVLEPSRPSSNMQIPMMDPNSYHQKRVQYQDEAERSLNSLNDNPTFTMLRSRGGPLEQDQQLLQNLVSHYLSGPSSSASSSSPAQTLSFHRGAPSRLSSPQFFPGLDFPLDYADDLVSQVDQLRQEKNMEGQQEEPLSDVQRLSQLLDHLGLDLNDFTHSQSDKLPSAMKQLQMDTTFPRNPTKAKYLKNSSADKKITEASMAYKVPVPEALPLPEKQPNPMKEENNRPESKELKFIVTNKTDIEPAVTFQVQPSSKNSASDGENVASKSSLASLQSHLVESEIGLFPAPDQQSGGKALPLATIVQPASRWVSASLIIMACIGSVVVVGMTIVCLRHHAHRLAAKKLGLGPEGGGAYSHQEYQDLCRQHMASKGAFGRLEAAALGAVGGASGGGAGPSGVAAGGVGGTDSRISSVSSQFSDGAQPSPSSHGSTPSWCEEPAQANMDISTGHMILAYMEDHLKNKGRLMKEWEGLCSYQAEPSSVLVAQSDVNVKKNRCSDSVPYDHARVKLKAENNPSRCDYINASPIIEHDPRMPAYIATQGALSHTISDFWQMVWENGCTVIVMMSALVEDGEKQCDRYWPDEGSSLYHIYEVNLVSEHIWCNDFLVRSFYLKNVQTQETRTLTQFHFLSWPAQGIPTSTRPLLDFRRKVNKCYRGRSCPIIIHCSDGTGRTGTYILIDMVLNRMSKGVKEIDIAATLEHVRDQRPGMVRTKDQFEFALTAVAEEVNAILKALPQ
ncbi:receptor-type tyrosine-protein phosphatase-like N isoform X1 [Synchiropus splendidus]|uniref:receptor-type tyrosine-protein phosphatase-like N isoform X1 n=1 Tax=Synchiropus splendidus TaxID=270530 RepID=UPI00237DA019|nr:receptor-type tyrosine-protein phosphatase-like N isoform X1 [Synchiropus splendidus]